MLEVKGYAYSGMVTCNRYNAQVGFGEYGSGLHIKKENVADLQDTVKTISQK